MRKRAPGAAATLALFAACILAATSCGQDPTFWDTSRETPPVPPRIPGGPSKMVSFDGSMFVASGNLFRYTASGWAGVLQPPGRAFDVAATTGFLYVLSGDGVNNSIWRIDSDGIAGTGPGWQRVYLTIGTQDVGVASIQTIFGSAAGFFAGVRTGNVGTRSTYGIWSGPTNTLTQFTPAGENQNDLGLLSGAAGNFISTRGGSPSGGTPFGGMFPAAGGAIVPGSEGRLFMGMTTTSITPSGTAAPIAITRGGSIFLAASSLSDEPFASTGDIATGALAEWDVNGYQMLVVGIQGGNRRFGYVEFGPPVVVDSTTTFPLRRAGSLFSVPGAGGNAQYTASLGRIPVSHLYQFNGTIFASTQSEGLWHYGSDRWRAIPR